MITAIEQAKQLYASHGLDLNAVLSTHVDHGYVFISPDRILLARPSKSTDPNYWGETEADMFYVTLAIGSGCIPWFLDRIPFYLPKLGWHRNLIRGDSRLHIVSTDRILNKVHS